MGKKDNAADPDCYQHCGCQQYRTVERVFRFHDKSNSAFHPRAVYREVAMLFPKDAMKGAGKNISGFLD